MERSLLLVWHAPHSFNLNAQMSATLNLLLQKIRNQVAEESVAELRQTRSAAVMVEAPL